MGDPWLRLIYVPACCTPVAQPMDAGIIAILKGHLRKLYGKWVVQLTVNQLARGVRHEGVAFRRSCAARVGGRTCSTRTLLIGWTHMFRNSGTPPPRPCFGRDGRLRAIPHSRFC